MKSKWLKAMLSLSLGLAIGVGMAGWGLWQILRPTSGEWLLPVPVGPWKVSLSGPSVLRIATHPFALRLLEGRTVNTRWGTVQWHTGSRPGTWRALCAPCTFHHAALGAESIQIARAQVIVERDMQGQLLGHFSLSGQDASPTVQGRWTTRIERRHAELRFHVGEMPIADAFHLFAAHVPELNHAQIDGRLSAEVSWRWPSGDWTVQPSLDGFRVAGLGTEALSNATAACNGDHFGTWLPRAVIAAEDQRFYEHPGYDLAEMTAAWTQNASHRRGASTISQQLAKLIYTGDQRSAARKLRELLYAVELDRTLGKARVLNLYLAMAPWGDGRCGADAAARHFLNKSPDALLPIEAAWLASLLRNPDLELAQLADSGQINTERVAWIVDQMRPMPLVQRKRWLREVPTWSPPQRALRAQQRVSDARNKK